MSIHCNTCRCDSYPQNIDARPVLLQRAAHALRCIIEIGKRDMSNEKYDGYFDEAVDILKLLETQK